MSFRVSTLSTILLLSGAAPAFAQARLASDTAFASMVAAERAFARHSLRINTQAAFLMYMAEDGLLYRPRVVRAMAYLRARPMPANLVLAWEPVFADISAAGDLGYTTGPWIASDRGRDADPVFGEYVTLWRRQSDGAWKAELDAGIPHGPDPIGPGQLRTAPAPQFRRPTVQQSAHVATLLAADSVLAAAASADGAAAAFARRATAHMRLLRPGRFPLTADSAISFLRATSGYTWKPVAAAVSRSGDLGYTYGVYTIRNATRGARPAESGDYLRIWRRDEKGEWHVALDLTSPAE